MARTYSPTAVHDLPADIDEQSLFMIAEKAMRAAIPKGMDWKVTARALLADGANVNADDVRTLLVDLRDNNDKAKVLWVQSYPARSPLAGFTVPSLEITLYNVDSQPSLTAKSVSADETEAKGRLAVMESRITRWLDDPTPVSLDTPARVEGSVIVHDTASTVVYTASGASPDVEAGWWRRTWRDHAMTLVITVVGTVLAAVVIVIFGLN